jgi:hypothetical protein
MKPKDSLVQTSLVCACLCFLLGVAYSYWRIGSTVHEPKLTEPKSSEKPIAVVQYGTEYKDGMRFVTTQADMLKYEAAVKVRERHSAPD